MRGIAAGVAVCVALLGLDGQALAQKWVVHSPPGAGYRVELPGMPRSNTRDIAEESRTVQLHVSQVNLERRVFTVNRTVFPPGSFLSTPDVHLDAGRKALVQNSKGRLREERRLVVGGVPARQLVIDMPDQAQVLVSLLAIRKDVLYQLIYVGPRGGEKSADVRRFLASFKLLDR